MRNISRSWQDRVTCHSTMLMLVGFALTSLLIPSSNPEDIFSAAALSVGVTLGLGTFIEGRAGIAHLVRVDILLLWVFYALTLLEFLFPQKGVESVVSVSAAREGVNIVLVGFCGLAAGRHLIRNRPQIRASDPILDQEYKGFFGLFLVCASLAYLHVLIAVSFDPFELFYQLSLPRFSQSWSRGRLGDAYALLTELGSLTFAIPPLAGLILARRREFSPAQKTIVGAILLFTLYWGLALGTRSTLAVYIITFGSAYVLIAPRITVRQLCLLGIPLIALLLVAMVYMVNFRTVGLSEFSFGEFKVETLSVDYNIVNISRLTEVFPSTFDYLGLEIPFNVIVRPIPRVLWPGKPEGLSISIETALGANSAMTLSCTFVGEAYMAGGYAAVAITSLFFGAAAQAWNRLGQRDGLPYTRMLYASGFLAGAIGMRSMLSIFPVMLPTIALWLYEIVFARSARIRRSGVIKKF